MKKGDFPRDLDVHIVKFFCIRESKGFFQDWNSE